MWRPELAFDERALATVQGYARAFCVTSTHHRGTEARPGLVLGLDRGGACTGVAYRIATANWTATLAYLRERELIYGVYREAQVATHLPGPQSRTIQALTYVVERRHPSYAGLLPLARQAQMIRAARGVSGANLDYLINTVHQLRALGICERDLERVLSLAGGMAARGPAAAMCRPAVAALTRAWQGRTVDAKRLTKGERRRFGYRWRIAAM